MPEVLKKISFIWVLIAVFILKEALWVAVIPPREAPDEIGHYGYVESLLNENGLPLLGETMFSERVQMAGAGPVSSEGISADEYRPGNQLNWIAQHPPFYYLLLAPLYAVLPHQDIMFSIFVLRFVSVFLGAVTLYYGWKALEKINPPERGDGTVSSAGVVNSASAVNAAIVGAIAFLPSFSFMSAVINNDNLVTALAVVLIYLLVGGGLTGAGGKALGAEPNKSVAPDFRHAFMVGLVMGILALTKTTALPLFGVALAVYAIRYFGARGARGQKSARGENKKQVALEALVAFAVPLAFAGWWYLRNLGFFGTFLPELKDAVAANPGLLTANPSLAVAFPEVGAHANAGIGFLDFLFVKGFVWEYFKNIWGAFGRFFVQLSFWHYLGIGAFTLAGLVGWVMGLFGYRGKLKAGGRRCGNIKCRTVLGLVLAVYIAAITLKIYEITVDRGMLGAMHGRYFFPALLPFFYFIMKGWERLLPQKAHRIAFTLLFCLFIVNDISALLYVVIPALY